MDIEHFKNILRSKLSKMTDEEIVTSLKSAGFMVEDRPDSPEVLYSGESRILSNGP